MCAADTSIPEHILVFAAATNNPQFYINYTSMWHMRLI